MTALKPHFGDVFNARAMRRVAVEKGLRLQDAGDHKAARAAYREALQWEKEIQRLEAAVRANRKRT
jgi:hypothetical protein